MKVYTNLKVFENDTSKTLVAIFDHLMNLETDPNPLAAGLCEHGTEFTDRLLDNLTNETNDSIYKHLLRLWTVHSDLHKYLLRGEVFKKLCDNIENSDAHVSMNSSEILESIFISEDHQEIISEYAGENYEEIMEVLRHLIGKFAPS